MIKYTGKNLEELLSKITEEKQCKKDEIVYNVLEEKKHFLGIGDSVTIEAYTPKDVKDFIFDYVGNYFTLIEIPVSIEISLIQHKEYGKTYSVVLDSENNALLIGKEGKTLRALSYVLKIACGREFDRNVNVFCDVGNYKLLRYKKVRSMASKIAKDVLKTKQEVSLKLPADERKEVHKHLEKFKNIYTKSEGVGKDRRLIIKYVNE